VNYKLKLKEAKALGLDQKKEYQKELSRYRKQLASGYLTDTRTSDALIKEAYDRSLERVNASHILTLVKPTASPQDTLKAYNKIIEARNKVIDGANFEEIAKSYSEDPSAAKNGGNLGWFSVFRMVYPFENEAFKTEIGEISQPFRTRFGYHIVKVNNREKSLGEVTVAHIMVAINEKRTKDQAQTRKLGCSIFKKPELVSGFFVKLNIVILQYYFILYLCTINKFLDYGRNKKTYPFNAIKSDCRFGKNTF